MSIWTLTAAEVRDLAASLSPTPGGGAISVFTATLGLALVQKGASISLKRAGEDAERRTALSGLCEEIASWLAAMNGLADEDSEAFRGYLAARSMPRGTNEEKILREAEMDRAIRQATRIPLASARHIGAGLQAAELAIRLADFHLLTDIFGGALLMKAAADAVLLNVDANLLLLADEAVRGKLQGEKVELELECGLRGDAVVKAYRARIEEIAQIAGVSGV